jgi:hypothetical protein
MRIFIRLAGGDMGTLPTCPPTCHGTHEKQLWVIHRVGTPWGHFATADINGESRVIDASLPTVVERVPRGADKCSPDEVANLWHEDNESHVFGGSNIAKILREAIHAENARAIARRS